MYRVKIVEVVIWRKLQIVTNERIPFASFSTNQYKLNELFSIS